MTTTATHLRSRPAEDATVVRNLPPHTRLLPSATPDRPAGWRHVRPAGTVGVEGWVEGDTIQRTDDGPAPPSPEPDEQSRPRLLLVLEAAGPVRFVADCRWLRGDDAYTARIRGTTTARYAFDADHVSCAVTKADQSGRLTAGLGEGRQRHATAAVRAPYGAVRVRTEGPWGDAAGYRIPTGFQAADPSPTTVD